MRRRRHWPRKCGGSRATTLRQLRKLRWWKGLLQIMMGRDESPVDDHRERELGPTIRAPPPCTPSCEQVSSNWPLISCPVSLYAGETGGEIVCPVGIIKAVLMMSTSSPMMWHCFTSIMYYVGAAYIRGAIRRQDVHARPPPPPLRRVSHTLYLVVILEP